METENSTILLSDKSITPENLSEQIKEITEQLDESEVEIAKLKEKLNRKLQKHNSLKRELKILQDTYEKFNIKRKINNFNSDIAETENQTYPWSERVQDILNNVFKLKEFRPKQKSAIDIVLNHKDLLVVMPTGGGKSLLYQLPAYMEDGFSVVVSPLISLINDQIRLMKQIKLNAVALNSSTNAGDKKAIFTQMLDNKSDLKLIYVTPEWLAKSKTFLNYLQKAEKVARLKRIVIDEVHCCSVWGHDFRPDYQYLGILRTTFTKIPFLGLTATATMNVLNDLQNILSMQNSMVITASFNRPNLYYKTVYKSPKESINQICDLLENYKNQTGIIYCNTIQEAVNLTKELKSRDYKCGCYHAQMTADDKERVYNKWVNKKYLFVIATVAFGMGIDMPDVRFVIHYCVPRTIENLYQETGRAGRDGQRADCIVLYNLFDYLNVAKNSHSTDERKNFSKMLDYCLVDYYCRRRLIFNYFEQEWHQNQCKKMCDYCEQPSETHCIDIRDYYNNINEIVSNASDSDKKLTLNMLLDTWLSGRFKPKLSREEAEYVIAHLISRKFLTISLNFTPYKTICYITTGNKCGDEEIIVETIKDFNSNRKRDGSGKVVSAKRTKSCS